MKYIYALLFGLMSTTAFAQTLTFINESDLGDVQEALGPVEVTYKYFNPGNLAWVISEVKTSCECITAETKRLEIKPNSEGTLTITFDPAKKNGQFNGVVSVSVKSYPEDILASAEVMSLSLSANVIPKPAEIAVMYPVKLGPLRLKSNYVQFDSVFTNSIKQVSCLLYNDSPDSVLISGYNLQKFITATPIDKRIPPNDTMSIILSIKGDEAEDWGIVYYPVYILINGKAESDIAITLFGYRGDNVANMSTAQRKRAPKAVFETRDFNFGKIAQGESVEHVFRIKNEGKEDLIIRKWKPGCGCTSSQPDKMVLKYGESAEAKAIFNSAGQNGSITKSIAVVTNDPSEPVITLFINGEVQVP